MLTKMTNEEKLTEEQKWSSAAETVTMLNIAIAHLEISLHEGNSSVETLTQTFVSIHDHLETIAGVAKQLPESKEKNLILSEAANNSEDMDAAIVNFQFYDKMTQRLNQIANGLKALSDILDEPELRDRSNAWSKLQQTIKQHCSIEGDRHLFDAILEGKSIEEAIAEAQKTPHKPKSDIEFF